MVSIGKHHSYSSFTFVIYSPRVISGLYFCHQYAGDEKSWYFSSIMTELLKAAIENGIIDLTVVEQQVIEMERKHYLDAHCYKIYEGKDGYWRTYLPDDTKKTRRTLLKKKNRSDLEDALINFYKERIECGLTLGAMAK